jgi:hypothetical protein
MKSASKTIERFRLPFHVKHDILILQVIPGLFLHKRNGLTVRWGRFFFRVGLMQFCGTPAAGISSLRQQIGFVPLPPVRSFSAARRTQ